MSIGIEKAMADVLNFASLEQKERLHGALDVMLKFNPHHGPDGRFSSGGVGGMAPDTGGGGGGLSYDDKIEGTQKEADREVKRAAKGVEKAKVALEAIKSKVSSLEDIKALTQRLSDIDKRRNELQAKLEASKARIADLKALLKKKSVESELLSALVDIRKQTKEMALVSDALYALIKELDALS